MIVNVPNALELSLMSQLIKNVVYKLAKAILQSQIFNVLIKILNYVIMQFKSNKNVNLQLIKVV